MPDDTMDVTMPDGTVIQGVPSGTTQSQLLSKYARFNVKSQQQPYRPPALQGLAKQVSQYPTGPGRTIQEQMESGMNPDPGFFRTLYQQSGIPAISQMVRQATPAAPADTFLGRLRQQATQAAQPAGQFIKGYAQQLAAPMQAPATRTPASFAPADTFLGRLKQQVTEPAEFLGQYPGEIAQGAEAGMNVIGMGTPIRQAAEAIGGRRLGEAGGIVLPLAVQALLMGTQEVNPKTLQTLGAPEKGFVLPTGERLPATPGIAAPATSIVPKIEQIASASVGGGKLREAHALHQTAAIKAVNDIFKRTATETNVSEQLAKEVAVHPPRNIAEGSQQLGQVIKDSAKPLYEQVQNVMDTNPGAVQPVGDALSQWAQSTLAKSNVRNMLTRNPEIGNGVISQLQKLQNASAFGPAAGMRLYDEYTAAEQSLKAMKRTGNLSPSEGKIIGEAIDQLETSIHDSLAETSQRTGISGLQETWTKAKETYKRGAAMQDLGEDLEKVISGTPVSVQAGGNVAIRPQDISANRLVDSLTELSRTNLTGELRPSRLQQAVGKADAETIQKIADYLARSQAAGGGSMAAKFGIMGAMKSAAEIGMGRVSGAAIGFPGVTQVISHLMTSSNGARLLYDFLSAAPRTAKEVGLIARIKANEEHSQKP
jgi:hypothetical protein